MIYCRWLMTPPWTPPWWMGRGHESRWWVRLELCLWSPPALKYKSQQNQVLKIVFRSVSFWQSTQRIEQPSGKMTRRRKHLFVTCLFSANHSHMRLIPTVKLCIEYSIKSSFHTHTHPPPTYSQGTELKSVIGGSITALVERFPNYYLPFFPFSLWLSGMWKLVNFHILHNQKKSLRWL